MNDTPTPPPVNPLRVMTWNIKGAQLASLERLGQQIVELDPDVVALQEVFFDARWNGHVNQLHELAALTNMDGYEIVVVEQDDARGPFGAELGGMAVLTKPRSDAALSDLETLRLDTGLPIGARFRYADTHFVVSHLPVDGDLRAQSLQLLADAPWPAPSLLLGDLNTSDLSPFAQRFASCTDCGATYPASAPTSRLDWILHTQTCGSCAVVEITASDHLPVVRTFAEVADADARDAGCAHADICAPSQRPLAVLLAVEFPSLADAVTEDWLAELPADSLAGAFTHLRVALLDPACRDSLGLPRPDRSSQPRLELAGEPTPLCEGRHPGMFQPCQSVLVNLEQGVAELAVRAASEDGVVLAETAEVGVPTLVSVESESVDERAIVEDATIGDAGTRQPGASSPLGTPRFVSLSEGRQVTVPDTTMTLPHHPLHRRLDVVLADAAADDPHLFVSVFRVLRGEEAWQVQPDHRFSDLPNTAKDLVDELARDGVRRVSIPGTAFDEPGVYFILSSVLSRSQDSEGLHPGSGALTGSTTNQVVWVE